MPYRRRYPRRRYYRRRRPRTRMQNYKAGFGQLASDVRKLKNLINVEFKWFDTHLSSTVSSTGTWQLLNGIGQGDTATLRDGNQIRIKSVECKLQFKLNASATTSTIRTFLVLDMDPDGATPVIADLLDTAIGSAIVAPRTMSNRRRFLILKEKTFNLSDAGNKVSCPKTLYKKLDIKTLYDGSNSTIAGIKEHALFMVYVSDSSVNNPAIEAHHRIRYIDN